MQAYDNSTQQPIKFVDFIVVFIGTLFYSGTVSAQNVKVRYWKQRSIHPIIILSSIVYSSWLEAAEAARG